MPESFLPYGRQWVDEADIEAVVDVLRGDYLTTGPAVTAFEGALADVTGARHAVAVNSGTSALHAMYFAAGLEAEDEIITSPLTFAATANAALYLGAKVRFVDVQSDTGNIDPELVKANINESTKLVVPVDFAGHPADYGPLRRVANEAGIGLLSDAAHSLGATYDGESVGTLADATEVSFHPVKPVTTAEGGAVLTNDPELARRARLFQTHGISKAPEEFWVKWEGSWWYEQHYLGFNYRITDIQAALGASQLAKLEGFIARRREIARRYTSALTGVEGLQLPLERQNVESGWHLFVVRVADPKARRPFFEALRGYGLGVQVHYIPVYWHPLYQELGYKRGMCPVAEDYYSRAVSLPIYPRMSDDEVALSIERVIRAAEEVL